MCDVASKGAASKAASEQACLPESPGHVTLASTLAFTIEFARMRGVIIGTYLPKCIFLRCALSGADPSSCASVPQRTGARWPRPPVSRRTRQLTVSCRSHGSTQCRWLGAQQSVAASAPEQHGTTRSWSRSEGGVLISHTHARIYLYVVQASHAHIHFLECASDLRPAR